MEFMRAIFRSTAVIVLGIGVIGALAAPQFPLWNPIHPTPSMSHGASPASQTVTSATSSFSMTSYVSDKDTYQRTVDPNDHQERPGGENDIEVETDGYLNASTTNISWDADLGKRTYTYVWNGPFTYLTSSGDVKSVIVKFRGDDLVETPARQDATTNYTNCQINYQYVPRVEAGD